MFKFPTNNSFDVGLAVFYAHYMDYSPYNYQKNADQDTLKNLFCFQKHDTDDANGCLTNKGYDDLEAHFHGKAYLANVHEQMSSSVDWI